MIRKKVERKTGSNKEVRESRFTFGIWLLSKEKKKTRFHCAFTIAEQDNPNGKTITDITILTVV